jgi:hypothetical protein
MIRNNNIIGKSLSEKIYKIFFLKQKLLKGDNQINKNCLGSFQVLWNKNCTTKNEKKNMKILIKNLYQKNNQKRGKN